MLPYLVEQETALGSDGRADCRCARVQRAFAQRLFQIANQEGRLVRYSSPITSRSNWANDSSTLSISRPMLEVVLKGWVTETKETP